MTLIMQEAEMFPKVITDSRSLTLSESCVRSDIANLIRKIYSPRPLIYCNMSEDSAVESKDNEGGNITISRLKEKEEKRFGFYFEPVSRNFAKTFMDSSTTSGSVSLPIVRHKPKRPRRVCECCTRKMTSRRMRSCKSCKSNYWSIAEGANHSAHTGGMNVSSCGIIPVHSGSSLKILEEIQHSCTNVRRNHNIYSSTRNPPGNRMSNQVRVDSSYASNLQVVPDIATDKEDDRAQSIATNNMETVGIRNVSFLQRVKSTLFGKNATANTTGDGDRPSSQKIYNLDCIFKRTSKNNIGLDHLKTLPSQKELMEITHKLKSTLPSDNRIMRGVSSSPLDKETRKLLSMDIENKKKSSKTITKPSEEDSNLEKVVIHSYNESTSSNHEDNKRRSDDGKAQDLVKCDQIAENCERKRNFGNEKCYFNHPTKYHVAYKGLRIEVNTDWAYAFWGRAFGACHSVVSFFIAFFLHFLTFLLQSLLQPIVFGTVRIGSDHLFKPCLSTAFESVIQPVCRFVERLASSLRDTSLPLAQCFGEYCKELSHLCKAFRIVEIHKNYNFDEVKNPQSD